MCLAVLQRALDIHILNLGPDANNVGTANERLGIFHYKRGDNVQTKRFIKVALRIFTKVFGPEHPETVKAKEILFCVS